MKKFYDKSKALGVLRNLEAAGTEDTAGLKLEIIKSEAEALILEESFTPLEALRVMRELNGGSAPNLPDADLTEALACFMGIRLKGMDRGNDLPRNAGAMFRAAESELAMQRGVEPVRLGIPLIDQGIQSGFYPGYVIGVTGHEGSLKSSLALHMAEKNTWENPSVRCLFVSLDMTPEMLAFRRISRYLNCHEATVRDLASAGSPDYLDAKKEIERLDDGRLFFCGGPLTLPKLVDQMGLTLPSLVILDYISLLQVPGETDQFEALKKAIDGIRELRDQTKAVFVILSQMSRSSKAAAKSGQAGSHAFGGSIVEHLLDVELELCLDEPLEEEQQRRLIVTVTKNRFGPSGLSYEVEYQGIAKKITGRGWRLKREKAAKPAFGARVDFRDLPDPPPPSRMEKGRGAEQGLLPGVLPEGTEEVEAWLKHDPGLESRLLEEAEKTFDPAVHGSIMGHYEALVKRRFRERTGTEIEGEPLKRGSG
ncbi:hypothetical protein SDC9_58255 [bioreactor metagenome]|uniref:SF4 helicase domain-containing protein n=1 Tax=bioreactor metagenome TaxID=1076179 RepID=A0A644XCJ3_9ZZZZ